MATQTGTATLDFESCYRALAARDTRFDGQFVTTVLTTGIYCRPSCPARTPKPSNVRFELTAAAAAARGFRACRRCLPDATPGSPLWNARADLAGRAMRLIADGVVDREGVTGLAAALGYTERHISRVLSTELGAGTVALARTHRGTTARLLLTGTDLPMSDIAFAAGFSSIRQFNDTIRELYDATPSSLRASGGRAAPTADGHGRITLRLPFRPPYDAAWTLYGLAAHAVDGLERWDGTSFSRLLRLPHRPASVRLTVGAGHVTADFERLDMRDLSAGVNRVRRLLDLDADPVAVDAALRRDHRLRPLVDAHPGIRIPGSVDGVETLVRVMMGQQVSVKAARTRIARLVSDLGEPVDWETRDGEPNRMFPTADAIADRGPTVLSGPARSVRAITAAAACGERMDLHAGADASNLRADLLRLSGVGDWTADHVVMRVTGHPDILTRRDLMIDRALADLDTSPDDTGSWRPWRSYASMHLWRRQLAHLVDDTVRPQPPREEAQS